VGIFELMKHLQPFFEYHKSTRTNSISKEEFLSILHSNCKDWLSSPHALVRRKESESSKYSLIDPTESVRRSINKQNHVTMLMDNLPSWEEFPKRSRSVIFSVNEKGPNYAPAFGFQVYFVIPFDNAKFGVTPSIDLWQAEVKSGWDFLSGERKLAFNDDLSQNFGAREYDMGFSSDYNRFSMEANRFFSHDIEEMPNRIFIKRLKTRFDESGENKFMYFLNNILAPDNFHDSNENRVSDDGFKVMNYIQMINNPTRRGNECWTESKCLIYYAGDGAIDENGEPSNKLTVKSVNKLYQEMLKDLGI
jgi:hypothetical protein